MAFLLKKSPGAVFRLSALIFIFSLTGLVFFYTWCRVQCTKGGYTLTEETNRHNRLLSRQSALKTELARLKSPERIARVATTVLDMQMPAEERILFIR